MFLDSDIKQAEQELRCYNHSIKSSKEKTKEGKFRDARIYLENAIRSLDELSRLNNQKRTYDKHRQAINAYESDKEIMRQMVKMYE